MKKIGENLLVMLLAFITVIILLCGICLLAGIPDAVSHSATDIKRPVIVLDCGHGGPDGGAIGADGTPEKEINLSLGLALKEILLQNGYQVVMTREDDNFICDDHTASLREQNVSDLHNRLKIAEKYPQGIFISLHMNQFSESRYWGSQLFYGPGNKNSKALAESLQKALCTTVQKGNERPLKEMDSSVYIIYHASMPALLLECGFMLNTAELNRFKKKAYRDRFAFAVYLGLNNYLSGEKNG